MSTEEGLIMINSEQPGHVRPEAVSAILLFCLLMSAVACAPWKVGAEKDVVRNGIEFKKFRESKDGSKVGLLAQNTEIDSWPCRQGFIVFHPDWRLDELKLFRDYERNGISMPEGTWVFPDKEGNPGICMFPHDVEIQGYPCRGSWMGKEGVMTSFHDNGKLKHFFSRDQVMVDGVPCKGSLFSGISLHENGRLRQCRLAEDMKIQGSLYLRGAILRFDQTGIVVEDK